MRYEHQSASHRRLDLLHVLPISATEQHGPHLPAATDALIIDGLMRVLAQEPVADELAWLPHLYYGTSEEHQGLAPTLSLKPGTLLAVLSDITESLANQGVTHLAVLNGHGGNVPVLQAAARDGLMRHGVRTYFLRPLSQLPGRHGGVVEMHAGAIETSLILHLHPELVLTNQTPSPEQMRQARTELLDAMSTGDAPQFAWRTADLSSNGVIGEPSLASAELGAKLFDDMVAYMRQELRRIRALQAPAE